MEKRMRKPAPDTANSLNRREALGALAAAPAVAALSASAGDALALTQNSSMEGKVI